MPLQSRLPMSLWSRERRRMQRQAKKRLREQRRHQKQYQRRYQKGEQRRHRRKCLSLQRRRRRRPARQQAGQLFPAMINREYGVFLFREWISRSLKAGNLQTVIFLTGRRQYSRIWSSPAAWSMPRQRKSWKKPRGGWARSRKNSVNTLMSVSMICLSFSVSVTFSAKRM